MKNTKCLLCYERLSEGEEDVHQSCSKKRFNLPSPLIIDLTLADIETLASKSINQRLTVTGVQKKMSVDLVQDQSKSNKRLTMCVGNHYIVKTPTKEFPEMVELEDLCMHMAAVAGIDVAMFGLVRLKSGELAYLVKRFDRGEKKEKLAQEDFCQLSELPTSEKYSCSYEKAGKIIKKWSSNPGLDLIRFFEVILFSFITGNSDMHLKNFSLIIDSEGMIHFSPAYDLLPTQLLTEDDEEVALTLNAKKNRLKKKDLITLAVHLGIPEKVINRTFEKFQMHENGFKEWIKKGFLTAPMKKKFLSLVTDRFKRLAK